jgi:uncharacterized membrane protein YsdA (DUF1294 family)
MALSPEILWLIPGYLVVINSITFLFYWVDKSQALNGGYRISEKNLFLFAIVGGSPAAILACHMLRHKTKKKSFLTMLYLIAVFQIGLVALAVWSE